MPEVVAGPDSGTTRPMLVGDLDEVTTLETRVQHVPWSRRLFAAELGKPDRRYETVRVASKLVGFGGMWMSLEDAHITTVVVDPAHRRRGIGQALVGRLLDLAVDLGATAATLEVRAGNDAAQALYRHVGFAPVGLRPGYYTNGTGDGLREDAIIMWMHDVRERVR